MLEHLVEGNTARPAEPALIGELKSWIRLSGTDAVHTRDGPFSASSDNPAMPAERRHLAFGWFFSAKGENDKIAAVCNSAGVAVFVGEAADEARRVEVGRAYERCALQAAALAFAMHS